MVNKTEENLKKIEENVDKLEFGIEDFISRRIHHNPFQKIYHWLWYKSQKEDFIYMNDLARYTKLSKPRAYNILNELCEVGFLTKKFKGNLVEYWFVKNSNVPLLNKYIDKIKELLDLN